MRGEFSVGERSYCEGIERWIDFREMMKDHRPEGEEYRRYGKGWWPTVLVLWLGRMCKLLLVPGVSGVWWVDGKDRLEVDKKWNAFH